MDPGAFLQSDLRFLVPLLPQQEVALFDPSEELIMAVQSDQITTRVVRSDASSSNLAKAGGGAAVLSGEELLADGSQLPFENASLDHILVPILTQKLSRFFPAEYSRVLRPGGFFVFGIGNIVALKRLMIWKQKRNLARPVSFSLIRIRQALHQANFQVLNSFGIMEDLHRPQYLVALERPDVSRFFFDQVFYPATKVACFAQWSARFLTSVGFHSVLYRHLGIVARRNWTS